MSPGNRMSPAELRASIGLAGIFGLRMLGMFIAAGAHDIYWVIVGRVIQGTGAISAAVMALAADLTREEHRTKAMAMIGMTIGATFALSAIFRSGFTLNIFVH